MRCSKEEKQMAAAVGWSLLWAVGLDTDAQLEAEAQVRELEEELRLETDMQLTTTLLTLGMAEKLEEQDYKLENLACHFAKPGGHNAAD